MSDRSEEILRPEASRAAEAVRRLEHPPAGAAFRDQLKREFVSGAFTDRPLILALPPRPSRHIMRWAVAAAAAAASLIVLTAVNQPPRWTALPSAGSGHLVVNGVRVPVRNTAELTRRIRPGSRVRLDCTNDLDLVSSGLLAMQISPGTELVLPAPPGRWFGRSSKANVNGGLLRVTTGRRFKGARLAISTPEATIRVTGTTLAVIAASSGTCVCVLEGTAHVGPHKGAMTRVTPGSRCEVMRGRETPMTGEILGAERPKLADLRDRMQAVMN